MPTGSMSMVFTADLSTPLYSQAWTPASTAAYAGTCLFLVALAIVSRLLLASRHVLERLWQNREGRRGYVVMAGDGETGRRMFGGEGQGGGEGRPGEGGLEEKGFEAVLTARGMDGSVWVLRTHGRGSQVMAWRLSTDLPRAGVFVVNAGVGYLLMLAVMTLNVGYFLSVLAGLFVGELAVGRYIVMEDGHH